ncbi:serine/threonine-protein kinase [Nonomuraea guangzhouensis]|uniref:Serine/threonine-protein kinase n=1 Tax=Nonomuraea guangzhouensis TaxID=1291555 RepID=A0ABW4GJV4_9ACTN|nr:serine/threonine-protein kinase [Nonomuraea guangzhouensis]
MTQDDPTEIGPYRLARRLGAGGQGVVYLGYAPDGTQVAVKVLRTGSAHDDRLAKEIAAARRVEPFCIAQVLDASLSGRPYIVTEYVDGPSLQEAGRHTGAGLQRLAVATATALAAIHRAGVVHRDFKPANVLLGPGGPRVIDFGIARASGSALTVTSGIVGTPAYMAPEQLGGTAVGAAADVFAWGSVIVYAASGVPPFGNDALPAVINRILNNEPQLGDLPDGLRPIVYACLSKDPARRPTMQDVLLRLLGGTANPLSGGHAPGAASGFPGPGPARNGHPGPAQAGHAGPGPAGNGYPAAYGLPGRPNAAGAPGAAGPRAEGRPSSGGGPWNGAGAKPGRNRALLVGGAAVAVAGVMVTTVVWVVPSLRLPNIIGAFITPTTTPTPSPTGLSPTGASPTKSTGAKSKPSTTPSPGRKRPTRDPASTPPTTKPTTATTAKPSPTATTAKPTTASGGVRSVSLRTEGIDLGGCWRSDLNVYAVIDGPKGHAFTYRWLVDGQNLGRTPAVTPHKVYLPAGSFKTQGTHRVVFNVVSGGSQQRAISVKMCALDRME